MIPLTNAVTAYKNLAARGYDDSQIKQTLTSLKDAAAFGRQASYSYGEAIQSATEGLKNENSILVDNAGVTKNVAKMWDEYAKSIGKTSNNLTQQEKITAEVNGILAETKFQVGDAAKYSDTFSGRVARLSQTFFNLKNAIGEVVMPIVNIFIPAVQFAMDKMLSFLNVLKQVMSAFGLKSTKSINNTSSAYDAVGESSISAANDAIKASKKMAKATMGYDELNILSKNNDSSKSSSFNDSYSGPTVSDMLGDPEEDEVITSSVAKIIDKVKNLLNPLKQINFNPLSLSLQNFKNSITPFTKTIFNGLSWGYKNVFVPLAKYSIEKIIPNFLNSISSLFKIFNSVLNGFKPVWDWTWKNFFLPLAKWVGNTVSDSITMTSGALKSISDWASNNQATIDAMVTSFAVFFGLWKLTQLFAFIQMSGGLITAITNISGAIYGCTLKKIADGIETVKITALYAKDFLKSIITGTAALIKQGTEWLINTGLKIANTTATAAGTAATWLATAATTAFGVAMTILTSPITLVILAIAALVAGIILLVKNWDTVKAAAGKCWDWIKDKWNGASAWFDNNVIQPIGNFFKNMWNGIKDTASDCWNGILNLFQTGGKIFCGIKDGIVSVFTTIVNSLVSGINTIIKIPFDRINGLLNNIRNTEFLGVAPFKGMWGYNPLPVPKLPMLAQGGWVEPNKPRTVIVGDNKREGEIIAPESKIRKQVTEGVEEAKNVGKQELHIVLEMRYEDGRRIIQKINDTQIKDGKITILT